jgi:hypothetical protein
MNRIISEIVDKTLSENKMECQDNDVRHVFLSILNTEGLDIREKKSGIIDFITAGIELVSENIYFMIGHSNYTHIVCRYFIHISLYIFHFIAIILYKMNLGLTKTHSFCIYVYLYKNS